MLRIKPEIDLKELEKFGFKYNCFYREYTKKVYLKNDDDDKNFYVIKEIPRTIELSRLDNGLDDTLYDLITAGLVEKIEERN